MRRKTHVETAEEFFWRAIELATGGTLNEDIADVGRYVASRGDSAVTEFSAELGRKVASLRNAGVVDVLARDATTADGRTFLRLPEIDQDHVLEWLLLTGRSRYQTLLTTPEAESGPGHIAQVDLRAAVERARSEPGIDVEPFWQEEPGDRRRDGNLWIEVFQGLGVGVPDWNDPPWSTPGLPERFLKAAVVRSLDASWRAWRSSIGARTLDVWLEYCMPDDEPERTVVAKQGRATSVKVYRSFPRLLGSGDPIRLAQREANAVFDEIRATLV